MLRRRCRHFETIARARAFDGGARDYNEALSASDEPGIEQQALDGLEAIDRPVEDDGDIE
jgi:hypothetical protein